MNYLSLIIVALILLTVVASAVIAFIIRKNWASITMLVSIFLFAVFISGQIYLGINRHELISSDQVEGAQTYINLKDALNYLGYFTVPLFMVGLIGVIKSSASIYKKATFLEIENQQLSNKLNQL